MAHAADTKAECIAAADQGQSLRDEGKYLRARATFATCAREACPKVIVQSCTRWLRETDEATPTVVIGARDDAGQDLTDAHVTMDGAPLVESLDGKPLQADPGPHVFRFTRTGSAPAEATLVLRAGEKNRVVGVTMRSERAARVEPPPPPPPPPSDEQRGPSFFSARNVTALSLLVVGGGMVGGGVYLLGQSGSKATTASGLRSSMPSYACTDAPTSPACQQLSSAVDAQHGDATAGLAMIVGGSALVVGAAAVWALWPRSEAPKTGVQFLAPVAQTGGASLQLGGAF
jgi:hypothetical protein